MYPETELLYPYLQCFTQEVQPFDDQFYGFQKSDVSMCNLIPTCLVSDYDLGGEGDLFKAAEPIIEEQVLDLDPMSTVSIIPCAEVATSSEPVKAADIELINSEHLLNEVLYKCATELVVSRTDKSLSQIQDERTPVVQLENVIQEKDKSLSQESIQKSISSGCLSSMDWIPGHVLRPNFLDFHGMHFRADDGIRRAFSEGDIQTMGNGSINLRGSSIDLTLSTEGRMEKLSRYRKKKTRRNFGRTIKYACRKALADNQPRVRGRFAKTEESDNLKK